MAKAHLRRIEICAEQLRQAREELLAAVAEAALSGETHEDIARSAGVSRQRISQILAPSRESTQED